MVLDHNGLFARRFPIAFSGFYATDIFGLYQRRFDRLAINGLFCKASPRLLMPSRHSSPPELFCHGASPSAVAICLPLAN
jgi:hypothetical protein